MKLSKHMMIAILSLIIFSPFQLLTAKAEEEVKRAECSITIVSDKHTSIDKAATATGLCKNYVFGFYLEDGNLFRIAGLTNKVVEYSGQKFVVGLPNSNYGEANLTVYTVLKKKESNPPKQDNSKSQNNQPKKSNEPRKPSTNQQKKAQSDQPTKSTQQKQSQSQTSKPTKSTEQTNQQKSTSVSERENVITTNEASQNKSETETPEVKKESSNDVKNEENVENHKEDAVKENKNDKKAEKKNVEKEKEESGINKKSVVFGVAATTGALAVGGVLWFLKFRKV